MLGSLVVILISIVVLTPAKKWSEMDPLHVEDGPSWFWAAVSATWTTALLAGAIGAQQAQSLKLAAFLGGLAFGSAIGGCFKTNFKARKSDVPSWILRWWMAKLDGWADGIFKLVLVIPLGWLLGIFGVPDSRFWSASLIALFLGMTRVGIAHNSMRQTDDYQLNAQRRRMLIRGSEFVTMGLGLVALSVWLLLALPALEAFPPFQLTDFLAIFGLVVGIGLRGG